MSPTSPSDTSLVERLGQIAEHDWRFSFLAHTSDTAAEARDRIEALEARNRELEAGLRELLTAVGELMTELKRALLPSPTGDRK